MPPPPPSRTERIYNDNTKKRRNLFFFTYYRCRVMHACRGTSRSRQQWHHDMYNHIIKQGRSQLQKRTLQKQLPSFITAVSWNWPFVLPASTRNPDQKAQINVPKNWIANQTLFFFPCFFARLFSRDQWGWRRARQSQVVQTSSLSCLPLRTRLCT